MRYLLDTNVLSEARKSTGRVDPNVRRWLAEQDAESLFLSVMTILEIEVGIGRVERRDADSGRSLRSWLNSRVLTGFDKRILPVDLDVARRASALHVPDPQPERDALLAATALVHGMTVATRNERDFLATGVPLINPWSSAPDAAGRR